jgi:antirestriction protein ArdC
MKSERVKELADKLMEGVRNLRDSGEWAKLLSLRSGFWKYSFRNQMLIWMQNENATKVASFALWKKKGFPVKKGEKAIYIFAPLVKKYIDDEGNEMSGAYGFRAVPVFDISQTEAEAIPRICKDTQGECEKAQEIRGKAKSLPFVSFLEEESEARGRYFFLSGSIRVKESLSANQYVQTFIHEFCHKIVHEDLKDEVSFAGKASEEVAVESAAYMICSMAGIEVSEKCFGYVTVWLENGNKQDEEIKQMIGDIEKVANAAIKSLESMGFSITPAETEEVDAEG